MKWSLHTPEGASDTLIDETIIKQEIKNIISDIFASHGYSSVETPTFEFYDVFENSSGTIPQETMLKFFDPQGRILVLRPDITTPIARMVATKMKDEPLPIRLSYTGNAFRNEHSLNGACHKEFTQSGIELIGSASPMADAEVISITIKCLVGAGLENFQVDIGQVEFFKGLMEQIGLDDVSTEKMRSLVDRKDSLAIEEIIEDYQIDDSLKKLVISLPSLFGGIDAIESIDASILGNKAKTALENLKEIYSILLSYGLEEFISIDLGMVQSLNYYTGTIFKAFTHGIGYPVCGGGRYDNLTQEFGRDLEATGVAIGIDRLMSALIYQKKEFNAKSTETLLFYDDSGREKGFMLGEYFRENDMIVETYINDDSLENAKKYAREKNISGIVAITGDNITLIDLIENTEKHTTYNQLVGR